MAFVLPPDITPEDIQEYVIDVLGISQEDIDEHLEQGGAVADFVSDFAEMYKYLGVTK